jgi:hypothetical protein
MHRPQYNRKWVQRYEKLMYLMFYAYALHFKVMK